MENVLYNDLLRRGYDVDVGVVEQNAVEPDGKKVRKQLEVDFVVNRGDERCYIQSALSIDDPDKKSTGNCIFNPYPGFFPKDCGSKGLHETMAG